MKFYIADLHEMNPDVLLYTHRPFCDVRQQHDALVENWNERVSDGDEVFLLGDIGDYGILSELNGNITIVVGNHDDYGELLRFITENDMQDRVYVSKHPVFIDPVLLSHEPVTFLPPEFPYLNIHGHLYGMMYGIPSGKWSDGQRYFNVAVENIGYAPISEQEIISALGRK